MNQSPAFLLKLRDAGTTVPTYRMVAGLRVRAPRIHGDIVEMTVSGVGAEGFRELLAGAGQRSVSVEASGIFLGSAAEAQVRRNALSGSIDDYELSFEGGDKLRGKFLVQRLDYECQLNGERAYVLRLESSGPVEVV